jgi:hypothetical protein
MIKLPSSSSTSIKTSLTKLQIDPPITHAR